jgi:zinc transporter ZupT
MERSDIIIYLHFPILGDISDHHIVGFDISIEIMVVIVYGVETLVSFMSYICSEIFSHESVPCSHYDSLLTRMICDMKSVTRDFEWSV